MRATLVLSCGHYINLVHATDIPPETGPWSLWTDTAPGEGDNMTCLIHMTTQRVLSSRPVILPLSSKGTPLSDKPITLDTMPGIQDWDGVLREEDK